MQVDGADRGMEPEGAFGRGRRRGGQRAEAALRARDEPVEHGPGHGQRPYGNRTRRTCGVRDPPASAHAPNARPRVGRIRIGTL